MHKYLLILLLFTPVWVIAGQAQPMAEDQVLEKRVNALSSELRCLVCQNQTIADSDAELAKDLKNTVRTMLKEGKSEQQVLEFMVERYGDFVLYRPPLNMKTVFLWVGPFLFLLIGALTLMVTLKKRKQMMSNQALTEDEKEQLAAALKKANKE